MANKVLRIRIGTLKSLEGRPWNVLQFIDVLRVCEAIDDQSNAHGKSELKRIVSKLTRLIQRTATVSENRIEYKYEHRDAEHEYRDTEHEYEPSAES